MLSLIQLYRGLTAIHALTVAVGTQFFSKPKPDELKKKWDCIMCAEIQSAIIGGLNKPNYQINNNRIFQIYTVLCM